MENLDVVEAYMHELGNERDEYMLSHQLILHKFPRFSESPPSKRFQYVYRGSSFKKRNAEILFLRSGKSIFATYNEFYTLWTNKELVFYNY